jgi:FAD/FMN-containing dehydrogenase
MKRRQFCKSTLSASLLAAYPFRLMPASEVAASVAAISLDGAEMELQSAELRELAGAVQGRVLLPYSPGYDATRKVWNGMHDKHPAVIVRCGGSADIQRAVDFAREHRLLTAVRGGGHSWPGKSVCEGGIMIDLAEMTQVNIDVNENRASVQGGALLGHVDSASLQHGLVTTTGVVSHTGVGGFTLGGGFGRLNRKYGLAVDNVTAADIVTPDGTLRTVSDEQEPDLFWAIRGGGGNFGVVSRFEFRLYPFNRNVLSGMLMWPVDQAREVLDFYSDWYSTLSDELYTGPVMMTLPDGTSVVAMEVVYNGDPSAGEKELAPLRKVGRGLEDGVMVQDYTVMQTQEDAAFAHGVRSYIKNGMVEEFTTGLVEAMIESFIPDPRLAMFTHTAGGAVKRVGETDTAFPHRNAETMVMVGGGWTDPALDLESIALARAWFKQLEPFTGGYYTNIEFDTSASELSNYGPVYERLSQVKAQYDPDNLFRLNRNVRPAG